MIIFLWGLSNPKICVPKTIVLSITPREQEKFCESCRKGMLKKLLQGLLTKLEQGFLAKAPSISTCNFQLPSKYIPIYEKIQAIFAAGDKQKRLFFVKSQKKSFKCFYKAHFCDKIKHRRHR